MNQWVTVVLITGIATTVATSAVADSIYDLTVKGTSCQNRDVGGVDCTYRIGKDLEFEIAGIGDPDAGIAFTRSNMSGDFYAKFGLQHGCVIVVRGFAGSAPHPIDFAFVSPRNGRVYRTWQECGASSKASGV